MLCPRCGNEVPFVCPYMRLCPECVQGTVTLDEMHEAVKAEAERQLEVDPQLGQCRCVFIDLTEEEKRHA